MLGVHALRCCAQKELAEGSETKTRYFMVLLGELLGDVFLVFQVTLKELAEVNAISKKLFSHFIQIPSVAILMKDIMLSAPPNKRQQLQDMVRASVNQSQIMVSTNMSSLSEQSVQDSSSKRPESIAEIADCDVKQEMGEKVDDNDDDDDWGDDWDAFQSLPATVVNDSDSAIIVSSISEEIPPESSHPGQNPQENPQENTSMDISDMDNGAGDMEGSTYADKELEKPSDLQCSSTEPCDLQCSNTEKQVKHEFPGLSGEDSDELDPTVGCTEPLAHIERADKLQQVHDSGVSDGLDLPNEGIDQPVGENKGISGEFQGIEGNVLNDSICSSDDSTSDSNNLSDMMEDVVNKSSNNVLRVKDKLVKDGSKDCSEKLSGSSQDGMSENVLGRCEGHDDPANTETKPEPVRMARMNQRRSSEKTV
ncbi:hypothetical protein PR202_gb22970 [Eleusine coracana subsp. coracana]|uniref:Uncharacterized protein n=1 Tax=Eleusine coracana subsp. coracana TaxID=191504 RepID=A0AAV5FJ53_ELECO|nr:hypothetical protein PR202_gb22970 [Eleusine coracana subsp. coracana]